ncbi:ferritin-like domain-containing protein [Auraticoccus monumenti]|uniref:Ferritin-like domain-containing protein n=1 Tax=Auraticoccus monumenti TaxID=675864 RepID=A0A1G7BP88_9ACTN|nr:ferritin-like domain-containing protein [Auraticoccus monumenti]SDE28767.1 Ferritin-like domain-containing protein [Auraticoccus monumenti]
MNRRNLIKGAAVAIPGAVALNMLGAKWAFAEAGDFEGPLDVLNYALTLEYLEAEFYRQGNEAGLADGKTATYLEAIQKDEEAHVWTLQDTIATLGGTAVSAPQVDFGGAFDSLDSYLETAFTFENLGVQAYLGAAPSLFEEKELLSAAASIFGVEARHAAIIGVLQEKKAEGGVYMGALETPATKDAVLKAAGPFIVAAQTL